jgi:hypothetical protein
VRADAARLLLDPLEAVVDGDRADRGAPFAYVPYPNGAPCVSPSSTVTSSIGIPSSDATIWDVVVSWPCP